jgi:hypothetical protein
MPQTDNNETEHPDEAEATEEVGGDAVAGPINAETEAVNFCFIQCCGATLTQQAKSLNEEGFDTMEPLLIYKPGIPALIATIRNAAKGNGKGAGPKKIKAVLAKKLEGLFYWWCRQQRKHEELPLDPVAFTPEALKDALERMELEEDEKDHDDPQRPDIKFTPLTWVSWKKLVETYILFAWA